MRFTTFTFPAFSVTDALQRMHWNYGGQSCTLGGTLSSRRGAGRSGCRSMMQGEHLTGAGKWSLVIHILTGRRSTAPPTPHNPSHTLDFVRCEGKKDVGETIGCSPPPRVHEP